MISRYYAIHLRRLVIGFLLLPTVSLLAAEKSTWSIFATRLEPCLSEDLSRCGSVPSFHDAKSVSLHLIPKGDDFDRDLSVRTERGQTFPLSIDDEWNLLGGVDVLWSPDSRFLAVTGGLNAYTESTRVYEITPTGSKLLDTFREASANMLESFPPCKASNVDREGCERQEQNPFFNFAAIAWSGPNSLVVMSEIPCSSRYGGFMCQIVGYEIDIRTGHILHQMKADQFKARWQRAMAWNFRVPDPPQFKTTN
jgi:hypothetical protein